MDDSTSRNLSEEEIARLTGDTPLSESNTSKASDDAAEELKRQLSSLQDYRKALEQEFANATSQTPELAEKALDSIIQLVPDAGEAISYLIHHAESESVRANLAKWVFDKVLRKLEKDGDEDQLTKLIGDLTRGSKQEVADD